jgi:hypothetical protein
MPEILLRLRVHDHSGASARDTTWQRALDTAFPPTVGDDVQVWGDQDGPLAPVKRRWWQPGGQVVVEVVEMSIDYAGEYVNPLGKDGRLRWIPWRSERGEVAELLREAGWEVLADD